MAEATPLPKAAKRGRWSAEEKAYMGAHALEGATAIAAALNRNADSVRDWLEANAKPVTPATPRQAAKEALKSQVRDGLLQSKAWAQLKEQFEPHELELFEESYVALVTTFQENVTPAEEKQVMLACKFEILMDRNLKARKRARGDIVRLEGMQRRFMEQFGGDPLKMSDTDKEFALNVENQIQAARAAEQAKSVEYVKLDEKYQSLMKDLKGTRDQRVKQIEQSSQNWLGLLKALDDEGFREQAGRKAGLLSVASAKELLRLAKPHVFMNGEADQPILSSETVELAAEGEAVS